MNQSSPLLEKSSELFVTRASLFDFFCQHVTRVCGGIKYLKAKKGKWEESDTYKDGESGFWKTNCRMKNCGQNNVGIRVLSGWSLHNRPGHTRIPGPGGNLEASMKKRKTVA